MNELAQVGECCPYEDRPDYGKAGTIIRFGRAAKVTSDSAAKAV